MKSLTVIILVAKELNFVVLGGGGGGGGRRWLVGAQNSLPSAAPPKQQSLAAIGFHVTLFLTSIFLFFKNFADKFLSCQLGGQY